MEPFDVLNMGNILDFHSEPYNLHFFSLNKGAPEFKKLTKM